MAFTSGWLCHHELRNPCATRPCTPWSRILATPLTRFVCVWSSIASEVSQRGICHIPSILKVCFWFRFSLFVLNFTESDSVHQWRSYGQYARRHLEFLTSAILAPGNPRMGTVYLQTTFDADRSKKFPRYDRLCISKMAVTRTEKCPKNKIQNGCRRYLEFSRRVRRMLGFR